MFKRIAHILFIITVLIAGPFHGSDARAADSGSFTEAQKSEITKIIKEYIHNNPDAIIASLQSYQQRQMDDMEAKAEASVAQNREVLMSKDQPSIGNPDADVTVVEFFDYNCGYCKRALEDIQKVTAADKNVRFVFLEFPVLGPASTLASQWSLAAHRQGKYFEFHTALMDDNSPKTEDILAQLAKKAGLDVERMKKDAQSDEVKKEIEKNQALANEFGIQGTPGFIINDKLYRGYLGPEGLKTAIEEARRKKA